MECGTREREKTLCRGEIVKAAIEFILCGCVLISRDEGVSDKPLIGEI